MSNHLHIVARNRPDLSAKASDHEIAKRFLCAYPGLDAKKENRVVPTEEEIQALIADNNRFKKVKDRISSISWFMKSLNEHIARKANKEDKCKGKFWESRFRSQYLADEKALLVCSAYVDLNPIRAMMCTLPEESTYTGAYDRIKTKKARERIKKVNEVKKSQGYLTDKQEKLLNKEKAVRNDPFWLGKFKEVNSRDYDQKYFYQVKESDYLKLLDWTGREFHSTKRGRIPKNITSILSRLEMEEEQWFAALKNYGKWFYLFVGSMKSIADHVITIGKQWLKGAKCNEDVFHLAQ